MIFTFYNVLKLNISKLDQDLTNKSIIGLIPTTMLAKMGNSEHRRLISEWLKMNPSFFLGGEIQKLKIIGKYGKYD